ncbi:MAG: 2OG-Fe(II) oxygenase [Bacteriovoracaceae bacterium]|jgi:hypothetical protein|nr:2OG-Fe(II) oxygenase [Bacteriovoracaceae bacterium]
MCLEEIKTTNILQSNNSFLDDSNHYLVVDDFLDNDLAKHIQIEIESLDEDTLRVYEHFNAKVRSSIGRTDLPKKTIQLIDYLQDDIFLDQLRKLTGEDQLCPDKNLAQGGILRYIKGDFVNLHTDNLTHPQDFKQRTLITLLIYFNDDWKDEYNGILEIVNPENKNMLTSISPNFNRLVILKTNSSLIHGIPSPLACPEDKNRKAIVLWYYTTSEHVKFHPTKYYYKPEDTILKKSKVIIGNNLLRIYYVLKKVFGDWDPFFTKVMRYFSSK